MADENMPPMCDLRYAVEELIEAAGHVFGHLFAEGDYGTVSYFLEHPGTEHDLQAVQVSFDHSSLVVTSERGPHRMVCTFNSFVSGDSAEASVREFN